MALRHLAALTVAAALLAAGAAGMFSAPVMAQEQGWSLRDLLFPRPREAIAPSKKFSPPPKATKRAAPKPPAAAPEAPAVEKADDARVVLVIGDFLATGLADGLTAAFAENPQVRIVDRSNGSSGFVRADHYDWPKEVTGVIESEKPAVVIAMLGSNDRQQMQVGDTREAPRSEAWTRQYEERIEAFGKALAQSRVPFLWVGMPAFKSAKMTADMLAFNDIYRSAAQKSGGEFIDIWDGFTDENGAFVTTGPDINGQPVRLRSDDGINTTKAGRRKIAFYTEKPLSKMLDLTTPEADAPLPPAGEPVTTPEAAPSPVILDRTAPMLLSDPALDGGTELLGATPVGSARKKTAGIELPPAERGRADDFSWPRATP